MYEAAIRLRNKFTCSIIFISIFPKRCYGNAESDESKVENYLAIFTEICHLRQLC